mmetsp:Transcript_114514/g.356630  ORF Transcript_114514/g.356630 Transcript_114514/m.356630 type:complete len:302 (+) Transcript_114514:886-1791(+)
MNREIIVWAARNLTLAVFAPGEEVLDERTLFIVQRGVCAYKGRILVSGDIWGEDMLLSNELLRETEKVRSLGYLSVLMLHVLDLVDIVAHFPEARARLRWAQVQIALMRGVQLIAKFTRELELTRGLKSESLTEEQRMKLFADILQGKFASKAIPQDYLGVKRRNSVTGGGGGARLSQLGSKLGSSYSVGSTLRSGSTDGRLESLCQTVGELSRSVRELTQKVDGLSLAPNRSGSLGSHIYAGTRSNATTADFGPVVRPMISSDNTLVSFDAGGEWPSSRLPSPSGHNTLLRRGMLPFKHV